ncbi:MAG TPA: BTAD domain-containing putative transcriptional regulator [Gaiellaceae bacterium]|nr:BTAD domain-containing putative transcriptional regulator [Gaiellaceae bacterium]
MRVFLAGRVAAENGGAVIGERQLPGRQGRLLFAYLVTAQGRPVPRDELADVLWEGTPPATWDKAIGVLASKLRGALASNGGTLTAKYGCYLLELPAGTWVDIVAAEDAATAAEAALAAGDVEGAKRSAVLAESLLQQPFLPGDEGTWVEEKRRELAEVNARALTALADASLRSDDPADSVRWAERAVEVEPFRESGYRRLMEAHVAAGNGAEALRVYERCRRLLAEELGAYPSPETEALYRSLLEAPAPQPTRRVPGAPRVRRRVLVPAVAIALVAGVTAAALAIGGGHSKPPTVLPNSLVRIDPHTLRVTQVVPVESQPDLVVEAGGYIWNTNFVLRDADSGALRNRGDWTLTRVDPATGKALVVGGGLAPCGLTADPSGDVWVANCYPAGTGSRDDVVRVDAKTLEFEKTLPVEGGSGFLRGLAYGGGSLWLGEIFGGDVANANRLTRLNPQTRAERTFPTGAPDIEMAWAGSYGDLWIANFDSGSVTRLHTATGVSKTFRVPLTGPSWPLVDGDDVWVADWSSPSVVRLSAVGAPRPHLIHLPVTSFSGVWSLAAGGGYIWATTARDGTLWRIDPRTNGVKRIRMPYLPTGVAADANDVWVTVRGR